MGRAAAAAGATTRGRRGPAAGVALGLAAALLAGACASNSTSSSPTGAAGAPAGTAPAGRGWDCPGGSCAWDDDAVSIGGAEPPRAATSTVTTVNGATGGAVLSTPPTSSLAPDRSTRNRPGAVLLPAAPASSDDNVDFAGYLRYRDGAAQLGVVGADLPVEGRRVLRVVDAAGRPVLGADLAITDAGGAIMGLVKTYADGRAVFLPPPGAPREATFQVAASKGGVSASAALPPGDDEVAITLDAPAGPLDLDVVFVLDATSSMQDELAQLQQSIDGLADDLQALVPKGTLRLGLTAYRDQGDAFVTRTFDLTGDRGAFRDALDEVRAAGGGDTPEAVDVGLHDALTKPSWRFGETVKLLVLVGDAPPHPDGLGSPAYLESIRTAQQQGVKILAIGADGLDDRGEYAFRQLAQATMGPFVLLTSGTTGTRSIPGRSHPVTEDALSRLPLGALVAALASSQIQARG